MPTWLHFPKNYIYTLRTSNCGIRSCFCSSNRWIQISWCARIKWNLMWASILQSPHFNCLLSRWIIFTKDRSSIIKNGFVICSVNLKNANGIAWFTNINIIMHSTCQACDSCNHIWMFTCKFMSHKSTIRMAEHKYPWLINIYLACCFLYQSSNVTGIILSEIQDITACIGCLPKPQIKRVRNPIRCNISESSLFR